jgi:hypothetical protein
MEKLVPGFGFACIRNDSAIVSSASDFSRTLQKKATAVILSADFARTISLDPSLSGRRDSSLRSE